MNFTITLDATPAMAGTMNKLADAIDRLTGLFTQSPYQVSLQDVGITETPTPTPANTTQTADPEPSTPTAQDVPAEAEPTEPKSETTPSKYTLADIRAKTLTKVKEKDGNKEKVKALLTSMGYDNVSAVQEKDFDALMSALGGL